MQRKSREGLQMAFPGKAVELYDWVPESVKIRQQAAIGAVRRFVDTVDGAMPLDAASEIADRLVQPQREFLGSVVRADGMSLGASGRECEDAWVIASSRAPDLSRCEVLRGSCVRCAFAVGAFAGRWQVGGQQRGTVAPGEVLQCSW